ncbi:hypothetical protein [Nitrospirillum pindoramense]|uniref:Uncharacterized protein n=1 Tax=Nitrospirillum amazonense TaxID=28077 RepID=A0A560HH98_9PROT|nr:hypothetical protein [Nitrospirillum amazonense]TWB45837.1 hypothetical protein FBZ90_101172 [Nitrospirillum amazonense]
MKNLSYAVLATALILVSACFASHAADRQSGVAVARRMEVDVVINNTTANGNSWGGVPGALIVPGTSAMINLPSLAPSAVLCVMTRQKEKSCYGRRFNGDRRVHSPCAHSFDCSWSSIRMPEQPFALLILDEHMTGDKLVDVVLLGDRPLGENNPVRQQLDTAAREAAAELAPTILPWEMSRRQRAFQFFPLQSCLEGCSLRQSKIVIFMDD